MYRLFAVVALILALAACSSGSESASEETVVALVIDGDTIETNAGQHVRLVQIDAPELEEGECYGRQATQALRDLLPVGTAIRLEADERLDDVDRFGRLLRYAHHGATNVNLELVRRGAASVWFFAGRPRPVRRGAPRRGPRRPGEPAAASGVPAQARASTRSTASRPADTGSHPLE